MLQFFLKVRYSLFMVTNEDTFCKEPDILFVVRLPFFKKRGSKSENVRIASAYIRESCGQRNLISLVRPGFSKRQQRLDSGRTYLFQRRNGRVMNGLVPIIIFQNLDQARNCISHFPLSEKLYGINWHVAAA